MSRAKRLSAAALAALLTTASPSAAFTAADAHKAVEQSIALIAGNDVFPEKRAAIVAEIKGKEAAGRYDTDNPSALADMLSQDLSAAGHRSR